MQQPERSDHSVRPVSVFDEATAPERIAFKGRHPFSIYKLVFELADEGPQLTRLSASTWADFAGVAGNVYRALVIGSGAHRVVVRRMLKRIAAAAHPRGAAVS